MLNKAQGCLLGQICGDSLGSLVEFETRSSITSQYPDGPRYLENGGTFNTLAGQPTDDSEMALLLTRSLVLHGSFDSQNVLEQYKYWLTTAPFDCGMTIKAALLGVPNSSSQANGALMRVSPIGIFGASHDLSQVGKWAESDAALTHPNPVCVEINGLFAMAIAYAIRENPNASTLYEQICKWACDRNVEPSIQSVLKFARVAPPRDFMTHMGWVLIAFQNALYQLLHSKSFEDGVVETVRHGGDTDTNAAIAGAILGAVHGVEAVPAQWTNAVLNCRPAEGASGVFQPRPKCFWPTDVLELSAKLLAPPAPHQTQQS